jgi:hypothetical protein
MRPVVETNDVTGEQIRYQAIVFDRDRIALDPAAPSSSAIVPRPRISAGATCRCESSAPAESWRTAIDFLCAWAASRTMVSPARVGQACVPVRGNEPRDVPFRRLSGRLSP